ncbi:FAD/NAD(P)-binding protein [Nonomuraea sp. SBT364]|uniref:FAD/NAD(P)-binding protein n=1 Tax=Nonomuraea sp. SBT364 TaxID=1580530 RepID=UPI00066CE3C0|nr:FAD/NAD(P)-binding protein [Nonomuraea sp. SBT364]
MGELDIAVVGVGPRGLAVVERLLVRLRGRPPRADVTIWAFDAVEHGAGRVWRSDQPPWFGANTTAGESTVLSPDGYLPGGRFGSLARWGGLAADDYPPRALYGRYLAEVFAELCATAPPRVRVRPVPAEVTALVRARDRLLLTAGGTTYPADKAVLATGHSAVALDDGQLALRRHAARTPGAAYIPPGLAAEMPLDEIPPGTPVAVRGLGLTFYDVMRAVTVGRGGRFRAGPDGRLRYLASGEEPWLIATSRGGLPFLARPAVPGYPEPAVRPRVVTEERLGALRERALAATGSPQLDFAAHVEPLIQLEADLACERGAAHPLGRLARPFAGRSFAGPDDFRRCLTRLLLLDARRAREGCAAGSVKAATEMLRAIRPLLPPVVDFGGLLPGSHHDFLTRFVPESYVLSAGPPAEHVEQLAALLDAGIVQPAGPGATVVPDAAGYAVCSPHVGGPARHARVLLEARAPGRDVTRDTSPLYRQLLADGMISEFVNAGYRTGGLAVTRSPYRLLDASGRADPDIHALGVATDRTRWFTEVGTGRPGADSPFRRDADEVAAALLGAGQ